METFRAIFVCGSDPPGMGQIRNMGPNGLAKENKMVFTHHPGPLFNSLGMFAMAGATGYGLWQYWKQRGQDKNSGGLARAANYFPFGEMRGSGGQILSPLSVSLSGEVDGLFICWTIRQEFSSDATDSPIYAFSPGAHTLLDIEANIRGQKLAEDMRKIPSRGGIRKLANGLYALQAGMGRKGQVIVVKFSCARMLDCKNGQIEIRVPTRICEAPNAFAGEDAKPRYPFDLELSLCDVQGALETSGPKVSIARHEGQTTLKLQGNTPLTDDFIARFDSGRAHAQCVENNGQYMLAASFELGVPEDEISPLGLKILLDCSSSARGAGIAQALKLIPKILDRLGEDDLVSFSRFGTDIFHLWEKLVPASHKNRMRILAALANARADMGGTQLSRALISTFGLALPTKNDRAPCLLLISDGDALDIDKIAAKAREAGQRVFILGVGENPDEGALRDLARRNCGLCEIIGPNENDANIEAAIARIFERLREGLARDIRVEWPEDPLWQSDLPRFAHNGDTAHVFAGLAKCPQSAPRLRYRVNGKKITIRASVIERTPNRNLFRLGHLKRNGEDAAGA